MIRGHRIYKSVWTPFIGEELVVEAEDSNEHDEHAVAVMKDSCVVCARPSLYLPSLMVLPEMWWPHPLPCYRKAKAWSRPHPGENALKHAMVSRPQPVPGVYLRPGVYYLHVRGLT